MIYKHLYRKFRLFVGLPARRYFMISYYYVIKSKSTTGHGTTCVDLSHGYLSNRQITDYIEKLNPGFSVAIIHTYEMTEAEYEFNESVWKDYKDKKSQETAAEKSLLKDNKGDTDDGPKSIKIAGPGSITDPENQVREVPPSSSGEPERDH